MSLIAIRSQGGVKQLLATDCTDLDEIRQTIAEQFPTAAVVLIEVPRELQAAESITVGP